MTAQLLWFAFVLHAAGAGGGPDRVPRDERAAQSARQSLASRPPPCWYDPEADRLRRIDVKSAPDPAPRRNSAWRKTSPNKKAGRPRSSRSGRGNGWEAVRLAFWTLLAAVLLAIGALLLRTFLRKETRTGASAQDSPPAEGGGEPAENLPVPVRHSRADLLTEARRRYEQGDYEEAVVYLFSYELGQLDKHRLLRLAKGKTNRQYLREVSPRPQLFRILEKTMIAFEDVFFGGHRLPRERFESCWRSIDDFHRELDRASASVGSAWC